MSLALSLCQYVLRLCPSVASMDDLLRTGHTSCLVTTFHACFFILSFHGLVVLFFLGLCFCWLCCFCLVGAVSCFSGVCLFCTMCGMTSYDLTPRVSEAVTASASLAVIKTASKHLHNDLARAIEALEQKKVPIRFAFEAWPRPGLAWPRPGLAEPQSASIAGF